jgi:hypothetical protein
MQLKSIITPALILALISSCKPPSETSNKPPIKELAFLVGSWSSKSISGQLKKSDDTTIVMNIRDDGLGNFTSNNSSEGIYKFDFEILIGTKKIILFVDDGRQFIYNYEFNNNEIKLKSITSDIVITFSRS